ncbi:hypothetical protein Mterra_00027 [Calidithermus terrae]|uniref:Uncharacterized protein n=1 Tax=Calidithermus terrae TaxID=1408545 RepID=A0A399F6N4_9DEIN|nr:hypothetical protein [Calidithermus terrae]RIH90949.1 hypothetical protein Mterra_00027 [Calidithermus terrae]
MRRNTHTDKHLRTVYSVFATGAVLWFVGVVGLLLTLQGGTDTVRLIAGVVMFFGQIVAAFAVILKQFPPREARQKQAPAQLATDQ